MKTIHYDVKTALGLSMYPLVELSSIASKYESSICGFTGEFRADIKSLLSVVALEVMPGDLFTIVIDGADEEDAKTSIENFLKNLK
jgi:phosphotransferase system HPr-like phosphotransfer protein